MSKPTATRHMTTPKDDFANHCAELLSSAGPVRVRRMFGGHGVYLEDLFIAVVSRGALYLKADAQSVGRFEGAGGVQFSAEMRGRRMTMPFWTPPPEAMESPALMAPWARLAAQAAVRARAAKAAKAAKSAKPAKRAR